WPGARIHGSADVSPEAKVGSGAQVWQQVQIREGATVGANSILGKGVYIDVGVQIGSNCKLQNGVWVYKGFDLADGVFLGPGVMLLNDKNPRAINPEGSLKSDADWIISHGFVGYGAAVGGGSVVLPGVTIGAWALVGS